MKETVHRSYKVSISLLPVIVCFFIFKSGQTVANEASRPFDPAALYVRQTLPVALPGDMALMPDGSSLYVLQRLSSGVESALVTIDTTTYQTQTIPLGFGMAFGLDFMPDNSKLFVAISRGQSDVTSTGSNRILVMNPANGSTISTILTGNTNPHGPTQVAISPDAAKAYVTNRGPHLVHVVNTTTNNLDTTFTIQYVPMALGFSPDGSRVYTVNRFTNDVAAINTSNNSLITKIPLSLAISVNENSIAITSDGTRAFVTSSSSANIDVLDIDPNSPTYHQRIETISTTGNALNRIIVTPDDHYAFVVSRGTDELLVIDIDPTSPTYGDQVGQVTVGDMPVSVVFQDLPGIVAYVANQGDGTISVIGYQDAISGLAAANDSPTIIGSSTHLTATISAGTDVTYTWAFGDGSYGNGDAPVHTYPALGSYTAVVTATNQVSQMTATTTVNVVDVPVSGLTASNSSPTIVGNQTFLAAAASGGTNIQYTWAFGDGTYGNGTNPTHTYPAVGNYTAIVTATNTNNSLTASTQVQIIDVAISGLAAANDSPTLLGNATHLFATVSGGTNIQYTWAFGDGSYGNGASPTHIYPAVGNYTAIVTATNSNNLQTASTLVTITVEPSISFIYLPLMNACQATPIYADVVLVLDTSGSMGDPTEPGGVTKLEAAQNAAATFFTLLNFSGDQAALVSFDDSATLDHPLSQNEASLLNALNALQLGTQTRMDLGLQTARLELVGPRHDPDNHTFIIFLTDGYPNGTTETQVLAQATLAKNAGITIYTIGLGSDVNATLLQNVASNPAYYYPSPSTGDLNAIYQQIASSFACR